MIHVGYQRGIHVPALDLWLDPRDRRGLAFVSHAHSDHTGRHAETILTEATSRLMRARIGPSPLEHVLAFGEAREVHGGRIKLLPAGHVLGSAQMFLETDEGSLLYTGDFKLRPGLSSEPIAWCRAETLIMETTFGKPAFVFPPAEEVRSSMVRFCRETLDDGSVPVLLGYSLGKAQEILCAVAAAGLQPMLHHAAAKMTRIYRDLLPGIPEFADYDATEAGGCVIICPPGAPLRTIQAEIGRYRTGMVTGWALQPGAVHRYRCDEIFPLSDHAGYDELMEYVRLVNPQKVLTVHGFAAEFARDLRRLGLEAWSMAGADQLELPGLFGPSLDSPRQ